MGYERNTFDIRLDLGSEWGVSLYAGDLKISEESWKERLKACAGGKLIFEMYDEASVGMAQYEKLLEAWQREPGQEVEI